jgi:hypothetical protein
MEIGLINGSLIVGFAEPHSQMQAERDSALKQSVVED